MAETPFYPVRLRGRPYPVYVSPDVRIVPFLRALAAAGLAYRHDTARRAAEEVQS